MSFPSLPLSSKLYTFKWPLQQYYIILIFVLITNLLLLVEVSASEVKGGGGGRSRSVSSFTKKGTLNGGGFPKYRLQKPTSRADTVVTTSIEKPPVVNHNNKLDKLNKTIDETGVTVSPSSLISSSDRRRNGGGRSNSFFSWFDKLRGLKNAFSRLSNAMSVGEGRSGYHHHEHTFMDGAMVPMTFLLMAAFIMDILQRLFPLPYAKFVDDYAHSAFLGHHHAHPHARLGSSPLDTLTPQLEVKTPLGSIGVTTNDKKKEGVINHIFGRSNQGNPMVDDGSGILIPQNNYYYPIPPPTTTDTSTGDPVADILYLTNYNNAQQQLQLQLQQQEQQQHQQEQLFQLPDGHQQFQFQPEQLESLQQQIQDPSQQQDIGQQFQEQLLNLNIQQQEQQPPAEDGHQQEQEQIDGQQQQLQDQLAILQQGEVEPEKSVGDNNANDSDGNSLARLDYVDYYSRFDGNGQPWKKKKRSTHKAVHKS